MVFVLLGACHSVNNKYNEDTTVFTSYLVQHEFKHALNSDSVDFVLVSSSACHGCIQKSLDRLLNESNIVLISSSKTLEHNTSPITANKKYLVDKSNDLDRLKYHRRNIGIIRMLNNQIYDIIYLDPSTIDSVINKLYPIN